MKKALFIAAVVLVFAVLATVPVMAAPTDDILAALDGIPAEYAANVAQARAYLAENPIDDPAVASSIVGEINSALSTAGGRSLGDIPAADRMAIAANITSAATAAGLTAEITFTGTPTIVIKDSDGVVVSAFKGESDPPPTKPAPYVAPSAENPIKATGLGANFSALALSGAALAGLFVLALVLGAQRKPAAGRCK